MRAFVQLVRVPVLVVLLLATVPAQERLFTAMTRLDIEGVWASWIWIVPVVVVFCVVALAWREPPHSRLALLLEGVIAAVLGLVPPAVWIQWLGGGWFPRAIGAHIPGNFVVALALAWLVIVAMTMMRVRASVGDGARVAATREQ